MLKELREKRGKLVHDAREILDKAKEEKREITEEENTQWDSIMAIGGELEKLDKQIEREERQQEADRKAAEIHLETQKTQEAGTEKPLEERMAAALNYHIITGMTVASVRICTASSIAFISLAT
ncbi:unnamed protein product, partial [marine sediment metagenome]